MAGFNKYQKDSYSQRLLNRELHIFALSVDEGKNARTILTLLKQVQMDRMNEEKIKFYVNTSDECRKIFRNNKQRKEY